MAFTGELRLIGPAGNAEFRMWMYSSTTDTMQTIMGAGYFNNAAFNLKVDDQLVISASDREETLVVKSAQGVSPVVVAEFGGYTLNSGSAGNMVALAYDIAGGVSTFSQFTLVHKLLITDVIIVNNGIGVAGDTVKLQTNLGAQSISNAISMNGPLGTITAATNMNALYSTALAGANLRVTLTAAAGAAPAFKIIIKGIAMT